jgi:dihydropteroate synthase
MSNGNDTSHSSLASPNRDRSGLTVLLASQRPILMGILNVTPDSFSDGGDYASPDHAIAHALQMAFDGADIIDIGGESTRPAGKTYGAGSNPVSIQEEMDRVLPVIEAIRRANEQILISIDTQKSEVADSALREGADIINDVSAATFDPRILQIASEQQVPIILMHGHGPNFQKPKIEDYFYDDVVKEVRDYLAERIRIARWAGIKTVLADVGIGFAKGYHDNLKLLKYHEAFMSLAVPLVLGVSRKSTIGKAMGSNPPPKERLMGSIAAACYGVEHGAKIIRTHDVKETREALAVTNAVLNS